MNTNTKFPFNAAEIEIVLIEGCDIITASPYAGENEFFPASWSQLNEEE